MAKLHKTFVTPIDREDIHQLAGHLDDILDQTEAASSRIDLFCPDCIPSEAHDLAAVLLESAKLVQEMVGLLRRLKEPSRILEFMERATDCCEDVANITEGIVLENT